MVAKKIVIIGAGIAGLCAAVYARKCGYQVEVLEQHDSAGGLVTSWRRGDYTFETCLHWLLGSNPHGMLHSQWQEVFDIDKLAFVNPEEHVRLETEHGESLRIYSNVDRMEAELLQRAPQDATEIHRLASAIRRFAKFTMPDPNASWPDKGLTALRALPYLPLLRQWSSVSIEEYGRRFSHPLLRSFFVGAESARLSAVTSVFPLASMSEHNAGYPIGGSQAVIRPIAEKLNGLGGHLRLGAKVQKILVERDTAVGVQLADGGDHYGGLGHLRRRWPCHRLRPAWRSDTDKVTDKIYGTFETLPSYLQVSLGVARDLSHQAGLVIRILDAPLVVDPGTELSQVSFRFFHFDPTFAPPGKTAVTCFLPTRDFTSGFSQTRPGVVPGGERSRARSGSYHPGKERD